MNSVDYRSLLIAYLVTEKGIIPADDEAITFEVDTRWEHAPLFDRFSIEERGIDPRDGITRRYALRCMPRVKKAMPIEGGM